MPFYDFPSIFGMFTFFLRYAHRCGRNFFHTYTKISSFFRINFRYANTSKIYPDRWGAIPQENCLKYLQLLTFFKRKYGWNCFLRILNSLRNDYFKKFKPVKQNLVMSTLMCLSLLIIAKYLITTFTYNPL